MSLWGARDPGWCEVLFLGFSARKVGKSLKRNYSEVSSEPNADALDDSLIVLYCINNKPLRSHTENVKKNEYHEKISVNTIEFFGHLSPKLHVRVTVSAAVFSKSCRNLSLVEEQEKRSAKPQFVENVWCQCSVFLFSQSGM